MKYLIYGDDIAQVSKAFVDLISKIKQHEPASRLIQFDAEENDLSQWYNFLSQTLFANPLIIKVSHLYTGRKSKLKEKIKKLIKANSASYVNIVVVETKMIKSPPRFFDQTIKFKQKVHLFDLLDKIGSRQLDSHMIKLVNQDPTAYELFVYMLLKRLEDLMTFKSNKMIPKGFYQVKLKKQSQNWPAEDIIKFHNALIEFDFGYKSGKTKFKDPKLALGLWLFSYQF